MKRQKKFLKGVLNLRSLNICYVLLLLLILLIPANSYAYYWIGSQKTEIDSDSRFRKIDESRDEFGFLTSKYVRNNSDYFYTFVFNDNNIVIGTRLSVIDDRFMTKSLRDAALSDIVLKDIPYARALEVKSNLREYARNVASKKNLGRNDVELRSDEQFELIDFLVKDEIIIGLSISDKVLSIVTPELKSLGMKRMNQNMQYKIEQILKNKK